jgi:hypothetical protein
VAALPTAPAETWNFPANTRYSATGSHAVNLVFRVWPSHHRGACELEERSSDESNHFTPSSGKKGIARQPGRGWKAPASVAVKDIVHSPTAVPPMAPEAREGLLSAIAKARGWIEELRLGCVATLAEIAECEGFGERHVRVLGPLVAPRVIAATADGSVAGYATVTGLPQRLPDPWAEQERRQKM